MKISLPFEQGISGLYQSYKFGVTIEVDSNDPQYAGKTVSQITSEMFSTAVECTKNNIQNYAANDDRFAQVLKSSNQEIDKYKVRESFKS